MNLYAVIDTNVLVAALLDSSTLKVLRYVLSGCITPLYHQDILKEYSEVLKRPKFKLDEKIIDLVIESIKQNGIEIFPKSSEEVFIDNDDLIFYEVALEMKDENGFLVTGNLKHYPNQDFVVSPNEMVNLFESYLN